MKDSLLCILNPSSEPFEISALSDSPPEKLKMNEDTFNLSIRKFLKVVGISSQREIEQAVAKAIAGKAIAGTESFPAKMTLEIAGLKLKVQFDGDIVLE
jgi:hypothetical protein